MFWALVTAILAAWGWFALLLQITGAIAVIEVIPATLLFFRYHWLKSEPLPAQRPAATRRLPPPGSAARPAMYALGASERGFFSLLGVIERGDMLPADEIQRPDGRGQADLGGHGGHRDGGGVDGTGGALLGIVAGVSGADHQRLHRAAEGPAFGNTTKWSPPQRNWFHRRTARPGPVCMQQRYRDELVGATDRLVGWAQAFDELGGLSRR